MSQHHDSHSGGGGMEWLVKHMGGFIMPFGKKMEGLFEKIMVFLVNDGFRRVAVIYMVILTPLIVLEFLFHFIQM